MGFSILALPLARCLPFALGSILTLMTSASAQIALSAPDQEDVVPEAPTPLENLDVDRAWVEKNLAAAEAQLAELRSAIDEGETTRSDEEKKILSDMASYAEYRALGCHQHLDLLAEVEVVRSSLIQLRADESSWAGLSTSPPYSIAEAMAAWHAVKAHQKELESQELRANLLERSRAEVMKFLESSRQQFRRSLESLEATKTPVQRHLARQQLDLDALTRKFSEERFTYFRAREQAQTEEETRDEIKGRLLQLRLAATLEGVKLGEAELSERHEKIDEEIAEAKAVLVRIAEEEKVLNARLATLQAQSSVLTDGQALPADLQAEARTLRERANILRATVDDLNTIYVVWLSLERDWWQRRWILDGTEDAAALRAQRESNAGNLTLLSDIVRLNELTLEEVTGQIEDLSSESAGVDGVHPLLLGDLDQRSRLLKSSLDALIRIRAFVEVWQEELKTADDDVSLGEASRGWAVSLRGLGRRFWEYEIFAIDDKIVVDNEVIVEKRPITVGKITLALAILLIGLLLVKGISLLSRWISLPFSKTTWSGRLILEKIFRVGTIIVTITIALIMVKIPLTVFAFLGGALAIGIGFGAQTLINNFISGFILLAERPIRPGDIIEVEGVRGKVERIGERCTRVSRFDGIEIMIPNSQLLEQSVTNITHSNQRMRSSIQVGVAYGSPTRKVEEILLQIARDHDLVMNDPGPIALFESLGDNALNYSLYFWIDLKAQPDWRVVLSDLLHSICARMADADISIAFPQRDVHLDASRPLPVALVSKGGEGGEVPPTQ